MSDDPRATKLVVVETAKTPFEAQVIAAVLRGAGVPVYVGGAMLADEFAASQRLMGLGAVRVQVMSDRLEEAREALRESREAGETLDAAMTELDAADGMAETPPVPESGAPPARRSVLWNLGWPVAVILFLWIVTNRPTSDYGPFVYEATGEGYLSRWRGTGAIASESIDRDGDSLPEIQHIHNRAGERTFTSYDADGDGLPERAVAYAPDGSVASTSFDADRDGRVERVQDHHAWGLRVWIDTDGDGRFDRVEERDDVARLRRAWRIDANAGFVLER